jgi:hypothetical protein
MGSHDVPKECDELRYFSVKFGHCECLTTCQYTVRTSALIITGNYRRVHAGALRGSNCYWDNHSLFKKRVYVYWARVIICNVTVASILPEYKELLTTSTAIPNWTARVSYIKGLDISTVVNPCKCNWLTQWECALVASSASCTKLFRGW